MHSDHDDFAATAARAAAEAVLSGDARAGAARGGDSGTNPGAGSGGGRSAAGGPFVADSAIDTGYVGRKLAEIETARVHAQFDDSPPTWGMIETMQGIIAHLATPAPAPVGGASDADVIAALREAAEALERAQEQLGEAIHTSLRKACDHPAADEAHAAIRQIPSREWKNALSFVVECLGIDTATAKARAALARTGERA